MALDMDCVKECYCDFLPMEHMLSALQQDIGEAVGQKHYIKPLKKKFKGVRKANPVFTFIATMNKGRIFSFVEQSGDQGLQ